MYEKYKYQIWLHVAVFIFGTTGVLGKLISLDSFHLVWYRLLIAVVAFYGILYVNKSDIRIGYRPLIKILGTGVVLVIHWVTFFEGIKRSNVSVALVCLSSTAFSFFLSVQLVKRLTLFTFVMAINLEPIYAMTLAVLVWPESETMSGGFYAGAAIVVAMIFLNTLVSKGRTIV